LLAEDAERPLPFSAVVVMIATNLIPLLGVLFGGWKVGDVMGIFWAESVVMGFYTLLKIAVIARWGAFLFGTIFLWPFGLFTAFQFQFIYDLFVRPAHAPVPGPGTIEAITSLFLPLWPALLALFLIQGASFVLDFLAGREYEVASWERPMLVPLVRMILMQFTVIIGGWGVILLHSPMPALVFLVAFKVRVDLKLMETVSK
jgi:hypothetical protein